MTTEAIPREEIAAAQGRVARNAVIYFVAQVLTWTVSFTSVSIVPRRLGEAGMGQISLANAPIAMVGFAALMGIDSYLIYEVGRDRRRTEALLRATIGLRLALWLPMVATAMAVLLLTRPDPTVTKLGAAILLGFSVVYLTEPLRSALIGWEAAKLVGILDLMVSSAPLLAIPYLLAAPADQVRTYGVFVYVAAAPVMHVAVAVARVAAVRARVRLRPRVDLPVWRELARCGLPFLANELLLLAHVFAQVMVLKHFTDAATVGVYSQSYRLIGTFLFVPTALSAAMMPTLARLAETNPSEFRTLQPRVLVLLLVLGLPIATEMAMLAGPFCNLLYGPTKFARVPDVLTIGAIYLLPLYVVSIMYRFLVAQRKNLVWTAFLLGSISVAVSLSCVLVPYMHRTLGNGAVGTLIACTVAEFGSSICAFALLKVNPLNRKTVGQLLRAVLACAIMAAVMWATRGLFLLVPAVLGLAVFVLLGWRLRLVGEEEQARLVDAVTRRLRRRKA